jgi:type IV pilus assembly protein PilA
MKIMSCFLFFAAFVAVIRGQVAEKYRGDWLLINGVVVLHVDEDGTMTLRNSGAKGKLSVKKDGSFVWNLPVHPETGRFSEGLLFLKSDQEGSPKWTEYLEFRRGDKDAAAEVIEFALRQQTQAVSAFEKIRRSSMEKAMINNLRQLAAAADQFFLENGVTKVTLDQIVGPDKYVRKLIAVDGEDYSKLDLTQGVTPWKVVSASGVTASYDR